MNIVKIICIFLLLGARVVCSQGFVVPKNEDPNFSYFIIDKKQLSTSIEIEDYLGAGKYLVKAENEYANSLKLEKYTFDKKISKYDKNRLLKSEEQFSHVFVFPFSYYRQQKESQLFNKVSIVSNKDIDSLLHLPWVKFVELPYEKAVSEINLASANQRVNLMEQMPFSFKGKGMNIFLDDDGPVGPHIDYKGRINQEMVTATSPINDHADHLAGVLIGAGNVNPLYKGIADSATIRLYTYTSDISQQSGLFDIPNAYSQHQTYVTNTSQGNGCNAGYNAFAQILDQQVVDYPRLLHVFSAGNNGNGSCGYYAGNGFGTITGGSKLSKNTISVGNTINNDVLNYNSSQGPATDGRLKPEVVATGVNVFSTSNYPEVNEYDGMSGTSQASAVTAGIAAVLYEVYQHFYDSLPYSDLMKNILLNSAVDLGNKGPDFKFGFGKVHAGNAFKLIQNQQFYADSITNGTSETWQISVPNNVKQLKVMLYWHDLPATLGATEDLVNDLDLEVVTPSSQVFLPWVLNSFADFDSLNAQPIRKKDHLNNVEQVTIDFPDAGNYSIRVNSFFQTLSSQRFTLTYFFVYDSLHLAFPNGNEKFSPSQKVKVYWDHISDNLTDYSLAYSLDKVNWTSISNSISGTQKWYDWIIPAHLNGKYWLKISQGTQSDISDATFTVFQSPQHLKLDTICENYVVLEWEAVLNAQRYNIYKMGSFYMDSVATTTHEKYVFTSESILDTSWYAVQAINQALKSERSVAVPKYPGAQNCNIGMEEDIISKFKVYPNPAQDFIWIESTEPIQKLKLYDLQGRVLWQQEENVNNQQINLSAWTNNVYLLQITTQNDYQLIKKIIINK